MELLFLLAGIAAIAAFGAMKSTRSVESLLDQKLGKKQYLPTTISMLLLTAQASELLKAIEHASIVHIAAALLLLAIVVGGKSGTEGTMH